MYEEILGGKPERAQKIPKPQIKTPETNQELMSQANQAIEQYAAKPTQVRHPMGRGIPKDSKIFE